MTAPATTPAHPVQTHPCARCGAPVALDVGLCERCNPLGLRDSASSQIHGTVVLGVGLAIAGLAIAAHLAVSGIGPFAARVSAMTPGPATGVMIATIEARNNGTTMGSATCRITDPLDPALIHSTIVYSPRIAPGATVAFDQEVNFGTPDRMLGRLQRAVTDLEDPSPIADPADPSIRPRSAWADELAFAIETAAAAGAVLMDRYERLERIDHKSATDVVTEADHLSEELVIAAIRARFPGDAILAEESGAHAAPDSRPVNGRTWVIDPLDGTVNYANGLPMFCVSIGFVVDGRPMAGAVLDPTRGETFAATADGPATLNGRVIQASAKEKLSDYVISLSLSGRSVVNRARAIRKEVRVSRSMGSASLALAYVGNGRFDAFLQQTSLSLWDIAAAGLVAERAGATVTAFSGGAWYDPSMVTRTGGTIAAPPAYHARLLALANQR